VRCSATAESSGLPCPHSARHVAFGVGLCHVHRSGFVRELAHECLDKVEHYISENVLAAHHDLWRLEERAKELRVLIARAGRRSIPLSVRSEIKERDGLTCRYCRYPGSDEHGPDFRPWHIDHIIPVVDGGGNEMENLALACSTCNLRKNAMPVGAFLIRYSDELGPRKVPVIPPYVEAS
jgi:5-methylcytosine-specific restriction endonuclease McrA